MMAARSLAARKMTRKEADDNLLEDLIVAMVTIVRRLPGRPMARRIQR